jgi:hypothetical protein
MSQNNSIAVAHFTRLADARFAGSRGYNAGKAPVIYLDFGGLLGG